MSLVLNLNQIIGHEMICQILQRAINENRVANAYLFYGPDGVGKRTCSLAFAKALHCVHGTGCEQCDACKLYEGQLAHPDLFLLDAAGGSLKIDQIRAMQERLNYKAELGGYKVCIIDGADRLTVQAANSSLKMLEEPPGQTVIILTGESRSQFLPTILSRCQVLSFQPAAIDVATQYLVNMGADAHQAKVLARLFEGRVGAAVNALSSDVLQMRHLLLSYLVDVRGNGWAKLYSESTSWEKDQQQARLALRIMLSWYRDLLLVKAGMKENLVNVDWEQKLEEIARHCDLAGLLQICQTIEAALNYRQGTGYFRIYLDRILSSL